MRTRIHWLRFAAFWIILAGGGAFAYQMAVSHPELENTARLTFAAFALIAWLVFPPDSRASQGGAKPRYSTASNIAVISGLATLALGIAQAKLEIVLVGLIVAAVALPFGRKHREH